ncbi:unnamed protein product [Rotaria socialis]|uniref:Uncharacterized protein n=1 Tax=Rotaria socialis TaxID=392032 RepID=A0A821MYW3_9BILA|nr:unnamed protein product [Rotaria socialis]
MSYFVLADEKVNLLTTKTTTPTTTIQQQTPNAPSSEKNASSNSGEKPATKTATVAPAEPEKHEHDRSEQHGRSKREGKPAAKARGMRKPSKPSTVDCDKHHSVRAQDDNNLRGVLVVKSCHAARFVRKPSRVTNVANKFQSLLADHLSSRGVKGHFPLQISKVLGNTTHTEFHYTVPCVKSHHQTVIASLKTACKEAAFIGTITQENQPQDDDSSSSSEERSGEELGKRRAQGAKHGQKHSKEADHKEHGRSETEGKPAAKPRGMRKPSKPSTVDCDKDHTVTAQDDNNLRGVLVVKSCHAARFVRKPSRVTNVVNKFQSLLADHLNSRGVKGRFPWQISKVLGNSTHTEFHYTVPCVKSHHQTVIASLKTACKEAAFIGTITQENQPHDDDSSSARWPSGAREDGSYGSNESGEHELKLSHSPKHSHESRKHSPSTITRATTGAGHAVSQMITTVKDASSTAWTGANHRYRGNQRLDKYKYSKYKGKYLLLTNCALGFYSSTIP